MYEALEARGWRGERVVAPCAGDAAEAPPLRNLRTRLLWELRDNRFKPLWLLLWSRLGVKPHEASRFEFDDLEEAVDFIASFPRGKKPAWEWQTQLLRARMLPGPDEAFEEIQPQVAGGG
jgi:hypothetical protein